MAITLANVELPNLSIFLVLLSVEFNVEWHKGQFIKLPFSVSNIECLQILHINDGDSWIARPLTTHALNDLPNSKHFIYTSGNGAGSTGECWTNIWTANVCISSLIVSVIPFDNVSNLTNALLHTP